MTRGTILSMLLFLIASCGMSWAEEAPPLPAPADLPKRTNLPDPLTMLDGTPIKTAEQWRQQRRPELKRLFQHYVYGYLPPAPKIETKQTRQFEILDGQGVYREVEISFVELPADAPKIRLGLFLPRREDPAPVFLALNKCGNHTVLADPRIPIHEDRWRHRGCGEDPAAQRGSKADFWCVPLLIERGFGLVTFHESDIDPDQHDFTDGIHPYYADMQVPKTSRWGTIAAWAWGLHRAVDALVTDPRVRRDAIAVIGHSRRGKTALLAGAFDERIALVVPHQSGTGGMALSRKNDQETVERINRVFPHWFNDAFVEFNDREERLPVDQHLLTALVAPRPLLDTAGLQDKWANYESALKNLRAADKVYRLLGKPGLVDDGVLLGATEITANNSGRLLQYRLDERHTLNATFWRAILAFAEQHLLEPNR